MKKLNVLIQHIENSNLPNKDKKLLVDILKKEKKPTNEFIIGLIKVLSISKDILKLFDIDIGG